LKNIEEILGTDAYPRLRFGIGNNFPKGQQVDYVLGRWNEEEGLIVKQKIDICVEAIESFATIGLPNTMTKFNKMEI
jgi:PTH1 family peptidyl-tRNA hydrolase